MKVQFVMVATSCNMLSFADSISHSRVRVRENAVRGCAQFVRVQFVSVYLMLNVYMYVSKCT